MFHVAKKKLFIWHATQTRKPGYVDFTHCEKKQQQQATKYMELCEKEVKIVYIVRDVHTDKDIHTLERMILVLYWNDT